MTQSVPSVVVIPSSEYQPGHELRRVPDAVEAIGVHRDARRFLMGLHIASLRQRRLATSKVMGDENTGGPEMQKRSSSPRDSEESDAAEKEKQRAVASCPNADIDQRLLREAAAVVIQSKARQLAAKRRVGKAKEERRVQFEKQCQHDLVVSAATTLQANQRKYAAARATRKMREEKQRQEGTVHEDASLPRDDEQEVRSSPSPAASRGSSSNITGTNLLTRGVSNASEVDSFARMAGRSVNQAFGSAAATPIQQQGIVPGSPHAFPKPSPKERMKSSKSPLGEPVAEDQLLNNIAATVIQTKVRQYQAKQCVERKREDRKRCSGVEKGANSAEASDTVGMDVAPQLPTSAEGTALVADTATQLPISSKEENLLTGTRGEQRAALMIQCKIRQFRARKTIEAAKKQRKEAFAAQCERELVDCAATILQAHQRRLAARREAQRKLVASQAGNVDVSGTAGMAVAQQPPTSTEGTAPMAEACSAPGPVEKNVLAPVPLSMGGGTTPVPIPAVGGAATPLAPGTEAVRLRRLQSLHDALKGPTSSGLGWSKGRGLTMVFRGATTALLQPNHDGKPNAPAVAAPVNLLWGIRILHSVSMVLKSDVLLPKLELSRWVLGPLGSIIPATAAMIAAPLSKPQQVVHQ